MRLGAALLGLILTGPLGLDELGRLGRVSELNTLILYQPVGISIEVYKSEQLCESSTEWILG